MRAAPAPSSAPSDLSVLPGYHPRGRRHGGTVRRPACRRGKPRRRIRSMRHHPASLSASLATLLLRRRAPAGLAPASRAGRRGDRSGRVPRAARAGPGSRGGWSSTPARARVPPGPTTRQKRPLPLEPGAVGELPSSEPLAASLPPLFQVLVGETARISGQLRAVPGSGGDPERPLASGRGLGGPAGRPGRAPASRRGQDLRRGVRPDRRRSLVRDGQARARSPDPKTESRRGVKLPAGGASLVRRLAEPLARGPARAVVPRRGARGRGPAVDARADVPRARRARRPSGSCSAGTRRAWRSESPDGPSLAVQRLARTAGWHRLARPLRPRADRDRGRRQGAGPRQGARGAARDDPDRHELDGRGRCPPDGLAGVVGEIQLVRFAEPPASLEIDPSQDEARLVVGDQLYGTIRQADAEHVVIDVDDRPVSLDWSEVAGLYFRREPAAGAAVEGPLARVEWQASPGNSRPGPRFRRGGRDRLDRFGHHAEQLLMPGRSPSLATASPGFASSSRAGSRSSTPPPITSATTSRPRLPCSTLPCPREASSNGPSSSRTPVPRPAFAGARRRPGRRRDRGHALLEPGPEGRAADQSSSINGKRIDYSTATSRPPTRRPERIRIPIPAGLLKAGKNVLRIEQTGTPETPELSSTTWASSRSPSSSTSPRAAGLAGRRTQLESPDGRHHEDSDAEHGPARPRDRPRGRRPGDHAPRRRGRGRRRPLGADRGRQFPDHPGVAPARVPCPGRTHRHVLGRPCSRYRHDPRGAGQGRDPGRGGREPDQGRRPDPLPDRDRRLGIDRHDHGAGHGDRDRAVLGLHRRPLAQGRDARRLRADPDHGQRARSRGPRGEDGRARSS